MPVEEQHLLWLWSATSFVPLKPQENPEGGLPHNLLRMLAPEAKLKANSLNKRRLTFI